MNRSREFECHESKWEEMFGYAPYESQKELFTVLEKHVSSTRPLILEAPTGSGKSNIGLFLGTLVPSEGRIDYICSTTNLQSQIFEDANKTVFKGNVAVLFGRSQYYCIHLVKSFLGSLHVHNLTLNKSQMEAMTKYLNTLCDEELCSLPYDNVFWTTPMKIQVSTEFDTLGISHVFDEVWSHINASNCNIKERSFKMISNMQFIAKQRLSKVKLAIINSSIVMMYASKRILRKLFDNTKLTIWDEAHNIAKQGEELFKSLLPPPISLTAISDIMNAQKKQNISIINGKIELSAKHNLSTFDILFACPKICNAIQISPKIESVHWKEQVKLTNSIYDVFKYICRKFGTSPKTLDEDENEEEDDVESENDVKEPDTSGLENIQNDDERKKEYTEIVQTHLQDILNSLDEEQFDEQTNAPAHLIIPTIKRSKDVVFDVISNLENNITISMARSQVTQNIEKKISQMLRYIFKTNISKECLHIACTLSNYNSLKHIGFLRHHTNKTYQLVKSVELLNIAKVKDTWINEDKFKLIVPKVFASEKDICIQYDPTEQLKSQIFSEYLWKPLQSIEKMRVAPFFMSATITNKLMSNPFEIFTKELGIQDATFLIANGVFDTSRVTVYYPYLSIWRFNFTEEQKDEHFKKRIHHLSKLISLNPRASLVVGTHAELKVLHPILEQKYPSHKVLLYNESEHLVKSMMTTIKDWSKVIILGSEKMYIGLNLPGRIGLVAILRALNEVPKKIDTKYSEIIGIYDEMKDKEKVQHLRLTKQMQAMGRLMRTKTDYGVVAFLSHYPNDVTYVKQYYPDSKVVKELTNWPKNEPLKS